MAISIENWRAQAEYFDFGGVRIAYWTHGQGKPLLLVHGFPSSSWDWTRLWKTLGRSHFLIAADLIGFGLSDKPRTEYSIHRQTDMIAALLEHLGITEFDAMVHAYGASIGQELLARQQEGSGAQGLAKLVFLNGGMYPEKQHVSPIVRLANSPLGFIMSRTINRKSFGKNLSAVFGPETKPSEQHLDILWDLFCEQEGHRNLHRLTHFLKDRTAHEQRWVGALEKAQDRVGLINGASDPVSGAHSYHRWVTTMPRSNEHLISGIGHSPHIEAPAEVASTTLNWLA